jgi:hypothetical protein
MGLRAAFAAVAALLACAAPAAAVETGVNETLGQTVPTAQKAKRLGADWVRLWASWEALQPARGAYDQNCNMNATAAAIYAHRHTVAYRLERVKELTGLDPMQSEDRERLGRGLKAYRIIAPRLPR